MSSINSSGQTGNFISRLQGLKNVSGRRVMPGQELMQEPEYEPEPDLKGIAQPETPRLPEFGNFITPANEPEPDLGGQITSQSYDVRANTSVPINTQVGTEKPGLFDRLGRGLANAFHPENQELKDQYARFTPEEDYSFELGMGQLPHGQGIKNIPSFKPQLPHGQGIENIAPTAKNILNLGAGGGYSQHGRGIKEVSQFTGNLDKNISEIKIPTISEIPNRVKEWTNESIPGKFPEVKPQELSPEQKAADKKAIDDAQLQPYQIAAYGATDKFANSPELVSKFEEDTGIDFNPQIKEETEKYEKVLSNIDKGLTEDANYNDEQSRRINERILNNQATDSDKFYIGLALAMPLILGGIFGKEVGLGTLAGGAKGLAEVYKGREEGIREDEKLLADINKQKNANDIKKGELEIQRLELPSKIQKNLPKDEYEDIKNLRPIKYTDPNTGEVVAEGREVLPDLVMDMKYGYNADRRNKMADKATELAGEKAALERGNEATSNIIKAAMQIKDPSFLAEVLSYGLADNPEGKLKIYAMKNAPMIKIDGRMQNSAIYLYNQIELLNDAYRRSEGMKALTAGVITHLGNMVKHPVESGLKYSDLADQVLLMRDRAQNFFVDKATAQGFLKEPLYNKFGKLNREIYKGLNKKEEMKELERDKELMYGSE